LRLAPFGDRRPRRVAAGVFAFRADAMRLLREVTARIAYWAILPVVVARGIERLVERRGAGQRRVVAVRPGVVVRAAPGRERRPRRCGEEDPPEDRPAQASTHRSPAIAHGPGSTHADERAALEAGGKDRAPPRRKVRCAPLEDPARVDRRQIDAAV